MCDPVTAAGLALSMGGSYLESKQQAKNQKRAIDAKNDAFQTSQIQQAKFADETGAQQQTNVTAQGRDKFDENRDQAETKFKNAFTERKVQPDYNVGLSSSAPKNVVLARETSQDEADDTLDRDLNNRAALDSYGRAIDENGFSNSEFARLFGNTQSAASGQQRLLPIRMKAAENNSQKAGSMLPMLMKTAGAGISMGSSAGMFGGGQGFAVPFTGSAPKMVGGIPMPGTKPMFLQGGPFGHLGSA